MDIILQHFYEWDKLYPSETYEWPLMNGGPLKLLATCFAYLSLLYAAQQYLKSKDSASENKNHKHGEYLRPWMVVQNGCMYGAIVAGSIIILTMVRGGKDCLHCRDLGRMTSHVLARVGCATLLLVFLRSVGNVISLIRRSQAPIMLYATNDVFFSLWVYAHISKPTGNLLLPLLLDALFCIGRTTYLILSCP